MTETPKKKLIEVALPLEEINAACKADKDRKTGTIRNLHKWFAPAPLPAWRALIFAALVDDPVDEVRRAELLDVIKRLVANGADLPDPAVVNEAQRILREQFGDDVPTVMDPFCGGGSTLVEAQRLGLKAAGSDLNPVPALISRTLIDLLPKAYGKSAIHSSTGRGEDQGEGQVTLAFESREAPHAGFSGVVQDTHHYAEKVRNAAAQKLADYFPEVEGERPIAWIWARTAVCQNPACAVETVLTTSWWLSKKPGALAWLEPTVVGKEVRLTVVRDRTEGGPPDPPKTGRGANFLCLACGQLLSESNLIQQGQSDQLGCRLMCVVVDTPKGRRYREPTESDREGAERPERPRDFPNVKLPEIPRWFSTPRFGFSEQADLYSPRQLVTLATFAELIEQTYQEIKQDGGSDQWARTVATLLGLALGVMSARNSTEVQWRQRTSAHAKAEKAFSRNDLPMMWDFAETYFDGGSVGDWMGTVESVCRGIRYSCVGEGSIALEDARSAYEPDCLVATDPPYFDAIGYADLSDYFYLWHRLALKSVHPDLYGTLAAPKNNELTAVPAHHGGSQDSARTYFIDGFTHTFRNLQRSTRHGLPMLVIYASKEQKSGRGEETRWESILTAMIDADLEITGTWPIHMTGSTRMIGLGTNAVAAYIALVCRPRSVDAKSISLGDFTRMLRRELPGAIRGLQAGSILPVDLYQAALGPGMQIYSRYRVVEDSLGNRVPVGRALELVTSAVGAVLDEQEGELDSASRFAVTWWEQYGWQPGPFGEADKVARGYGTHVDDVVRAEVVTAVPGRGVLLLGAELLDRSWLPANDTKPTAWEAVHHLADRLISGGGEVEAAALLAQLGDLQDSTRTLAYRLHDIAARKGWAKDQERYNALIGQWSSMLALAATHNPEGLF